MFCCILRQHASFVVVHDSIAPNGKEIHAPPARNEPKNKKIRLKLVGQKKPAAQYIER